VREELATRAYVHHKKQLAGILKSPMELYQKWVFKLLKNASFTQDWLNEIFVRKLILTQDFDCVKTTGVFFAGQDDSTEASTANDAKLFKIIDIDVSLLRQAYSCLYIYL
jgi:hypothetical protein